MGARRKALTSTLRGVRYGEIFLITGQAGQLTAAVYNTTGLNDCPPAAWRSLDPHELAKDFGVSAVHLNGPRFWTLDQIAARAAGEVLSFGGLHLPEGWQYRARTPDQDLTLRTAGGAAHVLQDELQNTYMQR